MAGTYVADGDWSIDVIALAADGTFEERWISYDGTTTRTAGHWRLENREGEWFVVLGGAYLGNPFSEPQPWLHQWSLKYSRTPFIGVERLELPPDGAATFVKHEDRPFGADRPSSDMRDESFIPDDLPAAGGPSRGAAAPN